MIETFLIITSISNVPKPVVFGTLKLVRLFWYTFLGPANLYLFKSFRAGQSEQRTHMREAPRIRLLDYETMRRSYVNSI
jgi:hypothetical protein